MDSLTAIGLGLAGVLAGVPVAALAYSAPVTGPVRMPPRWWVGGPAKPALVATAAGGSGAASAVIGAAVPTPALAAFWLHAVLGIGLSIIDVRTHRLPFRVTGALWASSGLCFIAAAAVDADATMLTRAVTAGTATAVVLLIVALALPGELGLGDVALAGAITFNLGWLSWTTAATGLIAGLLIQSAADLTRRISGRTQTALPMGPALIAGWMLAVVHTALQAQPHV